MAYKIKALPYLPLNIYAWHWLFICLSRNNHAHKFSPPKSYSKFASLKVQICVSFAANTEWGNPLDIYITENKRSEKHAQICKI